MTNYLLRGKEFGFNTYYIENEAEKLGSNIIVTYNDKKFSGDDTIIRWGTTAHVDNGPHIINKSGAIKETSNKGQFRKKAADKGLAPKTWIGDQDGEIQCPVIVRPQFHSRSENLFFCEDVNSLVDAIDKCGPDYYISEYIKKDAEYRVFIAQGRAFIVAEKNHKKKDDVSWGCVDEGTLDYVAWEDWNPEIIRVAVEAFNLSKLHFAAVDVMVKDGKAFFLECNTAPEVWEYYGKTFAKVFTWMINNHSKRIPVIDYNNWKNCAHPAMSNKVVV